MSNVKLNLLKVELEALIKELDVCMQQIMHLDRFIADTENDPDEATVAAFIMIEKAEDFEALVDKVRDGLGTYIKEQQKQNAPVDFTYVKLLNQILKG